MKEVSHKKAYVRNPDTGKFEPLMAIVGESAYEIAVRLGKFTGTEEEWANFIEMERAAAVKSIEEKGAETLSSIPDDYTELAEQVVGKIDKTSIAQELGDSEEKVLSQKAASETLFDIPPNILTVSATNFLDFSEFDGLSISYNGANGFTAKHDYKNYYYGFLFDTEVGKEYQIKVNTNDPISRIRVMSNFNYPSPPDSDSDDFVLANLTDNGDGCFVGNFVADRPQASLNFYQFWEQSTFTATNITCAEVYEPKIKESVLPVATNDTKGVVQVGEGLSVHNGKVSVAVGEGLSIKNGALSIKEDEFEVITPSIYAINGVGNFEIFNDGAIKSSLLDSEYAVMSNWQNVISPDKRGTTKFSITTESGTTGVQKPELQFYSKYGYSLVKQNAITIRYANKPTLTDTVNILFIGDSLIASNEFTREFLNHMTEFGLRDKINLLGRCNDWDKLDQSNRYEAVGGYAWANYVNDPSTLPSAYPNNYFWNPTTNSLDIPYYFNTYCGGVAPDYIICNVGWNEKVNPNYSSHTFEEIEEMCKRWIDAVHSVYPNCRIILNNIHYGNPDDPYPTNYYKKWAVQLTALYSKIANETQYTSFVRFCDVAPYFDGRKGLPTAERLANRYSEEKEVYLTDFIHPNTVGYKMHSFADAMCFLYDYATK